MAHSHLSLSLDTVGNKLSRETMRRVLQEHVDAENARDRDRVVATYVERDPVFEDVPAGRRYVGVGGDRR